MLCVWYASPADLRQLQNQDDCSSRLRRNRHFFVFPKPYLGSVEGTTPNVPLRSPYLEVCDKRSGAGAGYGQKSDLRSTLIGRRTPGFDLTYSSPLFILSLLTPQGPGHYESNMNTLPVSRSGDSRGRCSEEHFTELREGIESSELRWRSWIRDAVASAELSAKSWKIRWAAT